MSKTRDTGNIGNVVRVDASGNVSFVSGSTTLMSVSSSGAVTTTGVISGSNALSASYSLNSGLLNGTGSVGFTTTGSLLEVSSSQQQVSASYISLSGSYNTFSGSASTRITANSSSIQQVSSSLLQVSASYISLSGSYNTFSGSASTRVTQIEQVYATTGSNSFRANQSITGSLVVSSTITAQTLVVQTITSSVEYSSGSNIFGSQLANTQTFTGSVNITGSQTVFGNVLINYPSSTTTGNAYARLGVSNTNATQQDYNISELYVSAGNGAVAGGLVASYSSTYPTSTPSVMLRNNGNGPLYLSTNGAIAMTITGSNVGIGTNTPNASLHVYGTPSQSYPSIRLTDSSVSGNGGNVYISADKQGVGYNNLTAIAYSYTFKGGGSATNYLTIDANGVSCFSNTVCAPNFTVPSSGCIFYCTGASYYGTIKLWDATTGNMVFQNASGGAGNMIFASQGVACFSNTVCSNGLYATGQIQAIYANAKLSVGDGTSGMTLGLWDGTNNRIEGSGREMFITEYGSCAIKMGINGNEHFRIAGNGNALFQCAVCSQCLTTFGGGLTENFSSTGGGHVNRYLAVKYMNENATTAFFKITTSGASSTHIQLAASNAAVGWYSSQIYHAGNSAYWGGFVGSGQNISIASGNAGYISSTYTDNSGNQTFCVTVANNGTSTQSLVWAYITTITYGGYSTTFTQL